MSNLREFKKSAKSEILTQIFADAKKFCKRILKVKEDVICLSGDSEQEVEIREDAKWESPFEVIRKFIDSCLSLWKYGYVPNLSDTSTHTTAVKS